MELHDYLRIVKRRKWIIIQAVVVVTVVAIVGSMLQKPSYQATATLLVREKSISSTLFGQLLPELSGQAERTLQTQVDLVKLRPVLAEVVKSLSLSMSPEQLATKVDVEARPQSNLLILSVTDPSPEMAQRLANELSAQYIKWSQNLTNQDVVAARDEIQLKLKETEQNLVDIAKKITLAGGPTKVSEEVTARWGMATQLYTMLAEKYEQLRILSATQSGGSIMASPATVPRSPVSPRPVRNAALGLFVGLVLGLGSALLIEYLDNTLKTKEDVEEQLGIPVLGQIPVLKGAAAKRPAELLVVADKSSPLGDWYKVLRTNLHYSGADKSRKSFMVTSAGPGEGKTTVSANLAAAFAQSGKRARVICADLRKPFLHELFGLSKSRGLTNVLCDDVPIADVLRTDAATGVQIVASGPLPPDPAELLASQKMTHVIAQSAQETDVVIIDAPPLAGMSDALDVATKTDGVILVVGSGTTTRESARRAVSALRGVDADVLGAVLVGVHLTKAEAYGYYGYGQAKATKKRRGREGRTALRPVGEAPPGAEAEVPPSYAGGGVTPVVTPPLPEVDDRSADAAGDTAPSEAREEVGA